MELKYKLHNAVEGWIFFTVPLGVGGNQLQPNPKSRVVTDLP